MDRRTVAKRLQSVEPDSVKGRVKRWSMKRALPALMGAATEAEGSLDAERTRLAREQADKLELENAQRRAQLVDTEEVAALWDRLTAECKTRMLSIPTRSAPLVLGLKSAADIQAVLRGQVYDALAAFADGNGTQGGGEAAADPDGEPVGGQAPEAKRGGERGARAVGH